MKAQIKLTAQHRAIIDKCLRAAGYPAALAKECGVNRAVFGNIGEEQKSFAWGTWIELVSYARRAGVVGPYFDPITLTEPPSHYDLDKEVYEAAWMLQRLPDDERERLTTEIAAAYGKSVARARDGRTIA